MGAMIFARHASTNKEFIFEVASKDCWPVNRGDFMIVETMHGVHAAQATSDLVECQDVGMIAKKYGAYTPLKQVLRIIKKEDTKMIFKEFAKMKLSDVESLPDDESDFLPY